MQFFALLKLVIALLPIIREAVVIVEQMFPGSGKGAQKIAIVRRLLEVSYKAASDTDDDFERLWPILSEHVEDIVGAYKALGIFRRDKDSVAAGPDTEQ